MFLAALVVGLLVAYYFGVRPGTIAAGITAGLFFLAGIIPSLAVIAYLVVGAGVAGAILLGPKLKRPDAPANGLAAHARRGVGQVASFLRKRAVEKATGGDRGRAPGARRRTP